jgi:hypothetical protein
MAVLAAAVMLAWLEAQTPAAVVVVTVHGRVVLQLVPPAAPAW